MGREVAMRIKRNYGVGYKEGKILYVWSFDLYERRKSEGGLGYLYIDKGNVDEDDMEWVQEGVMVTWGKDEDMQCLFV